ncbi:MAG: ABC transporter substrate-binding protein [Clostridia bacterium]|nr:ABC transporter substrate-binding protein [Clostridia bacterium]
MARRTSVWLGVLLTAAMLVLAACGGGAPSSSSSEPGSEAVSEGGPQQGQVTLVWGRGGDSVGLDPANVTDGESLKVTTQIFDTLLQFQGDTTNVGPGLATGCEPNQDATEWTCTLREGVKFQDGTPFNAEAVKFNFDRWMNTKNPYRYEGEEFGYYAYMFGGFDDKSVIKSVDVIDDTHVKFTLRNPLAPFLQNLAMAPFAIASPTAIQKWGADFFKNPVGTGPFKFVRWDKDSQIVLERNDDYWGEPAKVDQLVFRVIPDNSERLLELQSGTIQFADGISPSDVPTIKSDPNLQLFLRPANDVGYLAFNVEKAPFNDKKVRQAFNMAIDKKAIVDAFYGDLGEPANTPLPPKMWGHSNLQDYPYDPEQAKQLLQEAHFDFSKTYELWAMSNPRPYFPEPTKIAEAIAQDLSKIGVKVKIVTYDWDTYLAKTENGEHALALMGWIGDNGDPDNFLYVLLDKDNATKGSAGNIAFYRSDPLHELLIKAQQTPDQATRTQLYEQAQQIIHEDAPWVPLVYAEDPVAASAKVQGYVASPLGLEQLNKVSLAK